MLLVLLGTQFPDIVDKPLAWTFHVLPSGRTLAHSLFAAVAVSMLVGYYYRRRGRLDLAIAFGIGYFSHLIGDGYSAVLSGEYAYLSSLGWPLLAPPPFGSEGGFLILIPSITFTPESMLQVTLLAVCMSSGSKTEHLDESYSPSDRLGVKKILIESEIAGQSHSVPARFRAPLLQEQCLSPRTAFPSHPVVPAP